MKEMSWEANPYWQPPEEEGPRTARVREGVRAHVPNLRNVLFMVIKSWNDNVVLYEFNDASEQAVAVSWLSIEPEDVVRHQKLGNSSLRSVLNPAEDMLFGCTVSVVEGGRFLLRINQAQLADRVFELVMDASGNPAVIGSIGGTTCRVEYAYVQMKKGLVPDAEYMHFYGRSLQDGTTVMERIV